MYHLQEESATVSTQKNDAINEIELAYVTAVNR